VAAIAVLYAQETRVPLSVQSFYSAEDALTAMETTPIGTYDNEIVRNWTQDGNITDLSRPALEQIALFYVQGKLTHARNLTSLLLNVTANDVGIQASASTSSMSHVLFSRNNSNNVSSEDAETVLTSTRVSLPRGRPDQQLPPVIIQVRTWQ
jgi:hypothetical protein